MEGLSSVIIVLSSASKAIPSFSSETNTGFRFLKPHGPLLVGIAVDQPHRKSGFVKLDVHALFPSLLSTWTVYSID